jgi:hypothetical protein
MRKPDGSIPEEPRRQYERPHSDLSLVMIGLVCLLAWRRWYVTQKPADPVNLSKKYSKNILGVWL